MLRLLAAVVLLCVVTRIHSAPIMAVSRATDIAGALPLPSGPELVDATVEALEKRFQALYVALMKKQVDFKEAIEPYKTDSKKAGKA